jgi:hypothetical protein
MFSVKVVTASHRLALQMVIQSYLTCCRPMAYDLASLACKAIGAYLVSWNSAAEQVGPSQRCQPAEP